MDSCWFIHIYGFDEQPVILITIDDDLLPWGILLLQNFYTIIVVGFDRELPESLRIAKREILEECQTIILIDGVNRMNV